jgi:hypothetical protein
MMSLFFAVAAQTALPPDIVVEKKRNPSHCGYELIVGSRIRKALRCSDDKPDPQSKIDRIEAQRAIDYLISQGRLSHAASVR